MHIGQFGLDDYFFSLVSIFSVICGCTPGNRTSHAFWWTLNTCSAKRALAIRAQEAGDMTGANAGEITGVVVSIKGSSMKRQMKRKKSCKQGDVTLAVEVVTSWRYLTVRGALAEEKGNLLRSFSTKWRHFLFWKISQMCTHFSLSGQFLFVVNILHKTER